MTKRAFFSFHYKGDRWRAAQVRNIGVVDGGQVVEDNGWETSRLDKASIDRWIRKQMAGKSAVIVLVGKDTWSRPWIRKEIELARDLGKKIYGIRIHKLKDENGKTSSRGKNPFDYVMDKDGCPLSESVHLFDPKGKTSSEVYRQIADQLSEWFC
jgi:hypothetical protein